MTEQKVFNNTQTLSPINEDIANDQLIPKQQNVAFMLNLTVIKFYLSMLEKQFPPWFIEDFRTEKMKTEFAGSEANSNWQ